MSDEKTTMTFRVEKSLQDAYDQAAKPTTAPAPNCCATSCAVRQAPRAGRLAERRQGVK